ncbi:MAG TPA: hypothetical protein VMH35_19680 [Streptosporangiaceae bacterium]|nr:hypothetical protein [Streptosporangiaceae bacterium]
MTTDTGGEREPALYRGQAATRTTDESQVLTSARQSTTREPATAQPGGRQSRLTGRAVAASPVARHLLILLGYLTAGIAVTWPRASYLVDGKLPATRDGGVYVWDFWWMAHQIEHLSNPWYTRFIAAPVGAQLGYHALMPLEGVVMLPVTAAFGPSAAYNLLTVLMPGLTGYAMYRAARLWLPGQLGPLVAGAFLGLSSEIAWHAWFQLNISAGLLFLPIALEAAIRLRRSPRWPQALFLGLAVAGSLLSDQQSAVLVIILVAVILLPWLLGTRGWDGWAGPGHDGAATPVQSGRTKLLMTGLAVVIAGVAASPQIAAMVAQTRSGGAYMPPDLVARYYTTSGSYLPGVFSASPRVALYGLTALKPITYSHATGDGVPTFGLVLSLLALLGLISAWRRGNAWLLALLWLGSAALGLGATLHLGGTTYVPVAEMWHGVRVSMIMPFTWFVQLPGMAGFREAARILMLGFVPAAMLAGAGVTWLRYHAPLVLVPVLLAGVLELGWPSTNGVGVMRTALTDLDRPIAADHSPSIVVDVPFGIRGGVTLPGEGAAFDPHAQVLATADGHPRAIAYLSRIPGQTLREVTAHPFYAGLLALQRRRHPIEAAVAGRPRYQSLIAAARRDAQRMDVGWVILWHPVTGMARYLTRTGFRFDYRADGIPVYRATAASGRG